MPYPHAHDAPNRGRADAPGGTNRQATRRRWALPSGPRQPPRLEIPIPLCRQGFTSELRPVPDRDDRGSPREGEGSAETIGQGREPGRVSPARARSSDRGGYKHVRPSGRRILAHTNWRSGKTVTRNQWLYSELRKFHNRPLDSIEPPDIVRACEAYYNQGKQEKAHRMQSFI